MSFKSENIFRDQTYLERKKLIHFDRQAQYYNENIHLGFVFASPLVYKKVKDPKSRGNTYNEIKVPISFAREFGEIMKGLQEKQQALRYRYTNATDTNLREVLADKPIGLHFAMHGFKSPKLTKIYEKKAALCQDKKGDFLLFEKEDGSAQFFHISDVKNFKANFQCEPLEFIVINACHSENIGQAFIDEGIAKHVICILSDQQILDEATVTFSRNFYSQIFY